MNKTYNQLGSTWTLLGLLVIASIVSLLIGEPGITKVKVIAALIPILTFSPIIIVLGKLVGKVPPLYLLAVLTGGFIIKLAVVLIAVWYALSRVNWPQTDFVVTCISFMLAVQYYEALYFMKAQSNLNKQIETEI